MISIEITHGYIGLEGHTTKGQKFPVTPERARYLVEHGLARVNNPPGPAETKPQEPAETKKYSGAAMTGQSTDSPSSSAPGPAAPQLSSAADPASPSRRSRARKLLDAGKDLLSGSSESTTRTK
jgi:hypothetical protein